MKRYDEAVEALIEAGLRRTLQTEAVRLEMCVGRVTAEAIRSREALPSFDNSSMDGFAVRSEETAKATAGAPLCFRVGASVSAGDAEIDAIPTGTVAEIMTGAPLPRNSADAVIKVEDVRVIRDASGKATGIEVSTPIAPEMNVRRRGSDVTSGETLTEAGTVLKPEHILALAAQGFGTVNVVRRPRVAVIATGRELVDHSTPMLASGMIRNSTTPFLKGALPLYGVDLVHASVIDDNVQVFECRLREVLESGVDLVLTTGAVSMGIYDFVPEAVKRCGGEARFHKVAIRPGKPLLFAEFGTRGPVLIGVPGNPVSTAIGLRFFISPYLRALQRRPKESFVRATLDADCAKPEGLKCFFKARIASTNGGLRVQAIGGQASYQVKPLLESNAWVIFDEPGSKMPKDSEVFVAPLFAGGGFD